MYIVEHLAEQSINGVSLKKKKIATIVKCQRKVLLCVLFYFT